APGARRPPYPADRAPGDVPPGRDASPLAARRVRTRAPAVRARESRARSALARQPHLHRAGTRYGAEPPTAAGTNEEGARMTSIRVGIVGVGNCASSLVQG